MVLYRRQNSLKFLIYSMLDINQNIIRNITSSLKSLLYVMTGNNSHLH